MITMFLLLSVASPSFATNQKVNYVALGDSLAEGLLYDKSFGKSYAEIISEHLLQQKKLQSFSKEFAVSGYKSRNLLKDLQSNKVKNNASLHDTVKQASLITIHIGANDFLSEMKVNAESQTIEFDHTKTSAIMTQVKTNVSEILKEIRTLNSSAKIVVLGYYYPYVHIDVPTQETILRTALSLLNGTLQQIASEHGSMFVSLDQVFKENPKQYFPNPKDPHPNNDGYALIAKAIIAELEQSSTVSYIDVPPSHWAYKEIQMLTSTEILTETDSQRFNPDTPITRADAAKALLHATTLKQAIPQNPGFKDVSPSHDAYDAIAKLTELGVFNKGEYFHPDQSLTRAQMAKILTLMFKLQSTQSQSFTDVPTTFWAKDYIDTLASVKVTTGYADKTYRPNNHTTRSQFAVFLVRAMEAKVNIDF